MQSLLLTLILLMWPMAAEAQSLRQVRQAERLATRLQQQQTKYGLAVPVVKPADSTSDQNITAEPESNVKPRPSRKFRLIEHDIERLINAQRVSLAGKELVAFTSNATRTRIGYVLRAQPNVYEVYNDGQLVQTLNYSGNFEPINFGFTKDGRYLVHHFNTDDLYVDGLKVSQQSNYVYHSEGMIILEPTALVFPDGNTIRRHYPTTGRTHTLYYHPEGTVAYVRSTEPGKYYYAVFKDGQYRLYFNGRPILKHSLSSPFNFHIDSAGNVYSFSQSQSTYQVHINQRALYTKPGVPGFIFTDLQQNAWHVGVRYVGRQPQVTLYKNGTAVNKQTLYNSEGAMDFWQDSYAIRVADSPRHTSALRLLKDGHLLGPRFHFGRQRDFNGLKFSQDGTVIMRNFVNGHWGIYADGRNLTASTFSNAWYFQVEGVDVHVWGDGK